MFKRLSIILFLCVYSMCACAQDAVTDPTKPLGFTGVPGGVAAANAEQSIQLTSILIAEDRKIAIINGQSLRENQIVKGVGASVKKIEADAVMLQQNGKVWRVALNTAIRK